jgi:hypothetical protein
VTNEQKPAMFAAARVEVVCQARAVGVSVVCLIGKGSYGEIVCVSGCLHVRDLCDHCGDICSAAQQINQHILGGTFVIVIHVKCLINQAIIGCILWLMWMLSELAPHCVGADPIRTASALTSRVTLFMMALIMHLALRHPLNSITE